MLVREIMTRKVITLDENKSVLDASLLYRDKRVGCLVIVNEKSYCVGIVTERDLIERVMCIGKNPETTKVAEIMSSDIKTVYALDTLEKALQIMQEHHIKKLPVLSGDEIVGIVTITDISNARPELSERFMNSWVKPMWRD